MQRLWLAYDKITWSTHPQLKLGQPVTLSAPIVADNEANFPPKAASVHFEGQERVFDRFKKIEQNLVENKNNKNDQFLNLVPNKVCLP